jgi:alpha-tubulin suppressor-like RCC1 family protein
MYGFVYQDTKDNQVWGLGSHFAEICRNYVPLVKAELDFVVVGGSHTMIKLKNGDIFASGRGNYGGLGTGSEENSVMVKIMSDKSVSLIGCGDLYTLIYKSDGLWAVGYNSHGQLGIGNQDNQMIPRFVTDLKIDEISCGCRHSVFLSGGRAYSFGINDYGQLGLEDTKSRSTPTEITAIKKPIIQVCCGPNHTAILTDAKDVYECGKLNDKYCGLNNIFNDPGIIAIAVGRQNTYIILEDEIWGCGSNECGEMGIGEYLEEDDVVPKYVDEPMLIYEGPIEQVSIGPIRTIVKELDGTIIYWGWDYGDLGDGNDYIQYEPKILKVDPTMNISLGTKTVLQRKRITSMYFLFCIRYLKPKLPKYMKQMILQLC